MSYGLEPTQMDQYRSKHQLRLFIEDRLLEVRDVFSGLSWMISFVYESFRTLGSYVRSYIKGTYTNDLALKALVLIFISIVLIF